MIKFVENMLNCPKRFFSKLRAVISRGELVLGRLIREEGPYDFRVKNSINRYIRQPNTSSAELIMLTLFWLNTSGKNCLSLKQFILKNLHFR